MNNKLVNIDNKSSMDLANQLAKSELVPVAYRGKPENILVAMQWGREIGLTPMRSLNSLAVINGKPAVYGDELLALVKSHPKFAGMKEWLEKDDKGDQTTAFCEIKRQVGNEIEVTLGKFSVEDSKKARLWGKQGPWSQYPWRMLKMRARGFAIRDSFPDALKGIITYEEMRDYPDEAHGEDAEKQIKVLPSDASNLDALADKVQSIEDQTTPDLTRELIIPGKESRTFDNELDFCKAFADIILRVNQVEHWSNATKREKVEAFQKANAETLENLEDKDLQQEIMDKLKNFYQWQEAEEIAETERLSALADEMDPEGDPNE